MNRNRESDRKRMSERRRQGLVSTDRPVMIKLYFSTPNILEPRPTVISAVAAVLLLTD